MADEVKTGQEESGGIVTVIKTADSSDLDLLAILEANKAENPEVIEEKEVKPGKEEATTGAPKKKDDEETIDMDSLSPREQKLVNMAYRDDRVKAKKEARELKERTAALEAEIAGLKKGSTAEPGPKKQAVIGEPIRPRRSNFADDDTFEAAMTKYEDAKYEFRKQQDVEQDRVKRQQDEDKAVIKAFNDAADKFMEEHPDYEEVMDSDVPLTPLMFGYMLENGPALGYYWGQNPKEAEKLAALPQKQQEKAILRLLIKLENEAAGKPKADTKKPDIPKVKPEPPKPVAGRGNQVVAKDPSKMSFKEREKEFARTHPGVLNYEP